MDVFSVISQLFHDQSYEWRDAAVVGLLVILEGMLSIDNALVLGLLAKRLPARQRGRALWYGMAGAWLFRTLAVFTATLLLQWTFVKFIGGAYLVYISVKHLFFDSHDEPAESKEAAANSLVEPVETAASAGKFWRTVLVIELTDIAFAVDSILAAIALVGSPPPGTPAHAFHPKLWVIIVGGILGMMLMRGAAQIFIKLLERFPRFEMTAYLLVVVIGLKLLGDWGFNSDWSFDEPRWAAQRLGTWKEPFERLEKSRLGLVHHYEDWLRTRWIFGFHAEHPAPPPSDQQAPALRHIPHLLDFHSFSRPECLFFWITMLTCFLIGFLPPKPPPQ